MRFVLSNPLLLPAGTVTAVIWANLDLSSYDHFAHYLHFAANDIGMVFFFAIAAKEVFEATLAGATAGLAPQGLVAAGRRRRRDGDARADLRRAGFDERAGRADTGLAIPCATDIAFSAMIARLIFPSAHPAISFLLLVAIADDALGLVILAVFYPSGPLSLALLAGLMAAAVLLALWLRRRGTRSFWPYVLGPGSLSWAALYLANSIPRSRLVPIVPLMPHAASDLGLFDRREHTRADTLNRFEHWWATPVQIMLFFFGLPNARRSIRAHRAGHLVGTGGPVAGKADRHSDLRTRCSPHRRHAADRPEDPRFLRGWRRRVDRVHRGALLCDRGVSRRDRARRDEDGRTFELRRCAAGSPRLTGCCARGARRRMGSQRRAPLVARYLAGTTRKAPMVHRLAVDDHVHWWFPGRGLRVVWTATEKDVEISASTARRQGNTLQLEHFGCGLTIRLDEVDGEIDHQPPAWRATGCGT